MPGARALQTSSLPGAQQTGSAFDKPQAAKKKIDEGLAAELKIVKDQQALLALFGRSDEAWSTGPLECAGP